jgi:trimethylamine---corrinoid protein Co-methyltransferase
MPDPVATSAGDEGRRRGGRRVRQARPEANTGRYRRLTNPFRPLEVLSADQVAEIHRAALAILADGGIRVLLPEARRLLEGAGCAVDETNQMVRFDPDLVGDALASTPDDFEIVPRGPERRVAVGGASVVMMPAGGPPHATDLANGRRAGTMQDFDDFVRLAQHFDVMHTMAAIVEPQDVPLHLRHLETTRSLLRLSDKVPFVYARGRAQVDDCLEMIRIAHGLDEDELDETPRCYTVVNTNSPRQLDVPMAAGLIRFAEVLQPSVVTPFTLAGAMAPVTLAGALALQHAEALGGITLTQVVRPGAPVVYGAFTSNVDMRSGAPAFGTPEGFKAAVASGQLARHIGVPWRSSGVSTSNVPDAQSGYETMMNMMGAISGGANLILHTAGWLESGLSASFEKFILDIEMLQIFAETFQTLVVSEAELAVDAIGRVDPGSHFFGVEHTLERYATAFYEPIVFSRLNFEQWSEEGSLTAADRATRVWKRILGDFEPPSMDAAVAEELDAFVSRRTAEGGALPDDLSSAGG